MDRPNPKRSSLSLAGLPDEAMVEILARTPLKSVCRCKCVARAWRDLIDDPLNRSRLPQILQGFFSIFYQKGDLEHHFVKCSASSVPLGIDPCCMSFLTKLPEIERLFFVDSCNGLFLFKHCPKPNPSDVLGYIVCNPATKHWATVTVCASCPPSKAVFTSHTYLAFDPAVSSHFHLIQFWRGKAPWRNEEIMMLPLSVHTCSSETRVWSHSQTYWDYLEGWPYQASINYGQDRGTFANGILHLMVENKDRGRDQIIIVAVDVQGRTKRTIKIPAEAHRGHTYIGQSQGHLHYIDQDGAWYSRWGLQSNEVSIWVLQDYERQEWMLKDRVSFHRLFGRMTGHIEIVAIHPDRNVVFFHQFSNLNSLIAYDMDRKEVSVVSMSSSGNLLGRIVPYIPNFSESPALTNKS